MNPEPIHFKAETRQLLNILIHSLYTEREVFLREIISNASDALTRMNFEMLTNRNIQDPEAELGIWISTNSEEKLLVIKDTGIGMTAEELAENLGTIAHSGARAFILAAQEKQGNLSDLIGHFGVGFYAAFMVADWIRVTSRSYRKDAVAATWFSSGEDTFTIEPAEKDSRGTEVVIKLKEDAEEFLTENRLREIIQHHSNYIPYPIYLGENKEQINRQTALWRQQPRGIEQQQYEEFYRQFSMDFNPALTHVHLSVDAPVQMYALLYIPSSPEKPLFAARKQDGIALYARKILIQEYNKELLPEFFRFVTGVVDSEDIPLSVSRESVQSTRIVTQLKKVITGKLIDQLKTMGKDEPEKYTQFWKSFSSFIKEGVAADPDQWEALLPLLRYRTLNKPDQWISLNDYVQGMQLGQKKIYYIIGDDERSVINSPHLEIFRKLGYDVLLMVDPMDPFVLMRVHQFSDFDLGNVASEEVEAPKETGQEQANEETGTSEGESERIIERFKTLLGEKVAGVRITDRLVESPARLVDPEGTMNAEVQRVYRILNKEFDAPKKILEVNPRHTLITHLAKLDENDPRLADFVEQIYENALLIEGLHPDPASMISRIQSIMAKALERG